MVEGDSIRDESEVLADRLRWAAESLTIEFDEVSRADAERLIFAVAQEFLSEAKVPQFVPTFAIRRARQLLRDRQAAGTALVDVIGAPSNGLIDLTASDIEVIRDDDPIGAERSDLVEVPPATVATEREAGPASAPVRSPSQYATEAKRLLERAKVLRAAAPSPAGPSDC